jgi:hypothetical protein
MSIPSTEPPELRAGLTWEWLRTDLSSYPSPTWTLTYFFKSATHQFSIVATSNGSGGFAVAQTAAATAAFAAGRYSWIAVVSAGANKYQVDAGTLVVLPDFTAGGIVDSRTHARKALEMIEAYLEDRNNIAARGYSIAGRSLDRYGIAELLALRDKYKAEAASEARAERIRNGQPARNRILVRG